MIPGVRGIRFRVIEVSRCRFRVRSGGDFSFCVPADRNDSRDEARDGYDSPHVRVHRERLPVGAIRKWMSRVLNEDRRSLS